MVRPQRAALSAEPAQKIIHGETEWMQGLSLERMIKFGWITPVKGKPKPLGHWTKRVHRITEQSDAPWLG
jgi:hypothetical protein